MPLQPKLAVNEPGDKYEQEADEVADKVMRTTGPVDSPAAITPVNIIQQKCDTCGKEEVKEEEKEQEEKDDKDTGSLQRKMIWRKCADCEKEDEEKKVVQRKESGSTTPAVPATVYQTLQSTGQPLDKTTRSFMEHRFGFDFAKVQVHNDALAHQSAKQINALAYTHQNSIVFGEGQYRPQTEAGKKLLAHELTHVVQQGEGIRRKGEEVTEKVENKVEPISGEEKTETLLDPNDPEIVADFAKINNNLSKVNLAKWIVMSIANGWQKEFPVPDSRLPSINYNENDEPVIESIDFRGEKGAFNTASKILPKNVGAKFWWKQRFSGTLSSYKLDYASNKAYENLKLHEAAKDVSFEALKIISGDTTSFNEVMRINAYSDKLLSESLVRLIANTQAVLYPGNLEKQTGVLDAQTQADINLKIAADKKAAEEQSKQSSAEAKPGAGDNPVIIQGPVHDVIRKIIAQLESDIKAPVPASVAIAESLNSLSLSPIPTIPPEFLYRVSQRLMLGFYKHINTMGEQEIKDKFIHLLTAQFSLGYIWGQLKGIPQGIWNWIKDMAELIWELIKLPFVIPFKLGRYMLTEMPADVKAAYDASVIAMNWLETNKTVVFNFAKDMITGSGEGGGMEAITSAIKEQVYGMAEGSGGKIASQLSDFAGKSNEEMGVTMGKIQGYILPDILLAIFSDGIGNALKGAFQSIKIFIEAGRAGVMTLKALEMGKTAFATIEKLLESAKIFASKAYTELKTMLKSILEYLKKLLGFEEKALGTVKKAETLVEEGKAISQLETKADEALKKDAKKYADDVMEEGPEKQSKASILWKAVTIAEVADFQNLPIMAVMTELNLLRSLNPKVSFINKPMAGFYQILMIGSEYMVDAHYTTGKSAAEIGEENANAIRKRLGLKPGERNIGTAEVKLEGKEASSYHEAVSGKNSPPGTVEPVPPESRQFTTKKSGAMTREFDTETKLLEHIAKDLTPDAKGTITLYTERSPCFSCRGVIEQFRAKFPNMIINIVTSGM